jgi:CHAT domain
MRRSLMEILHTATQVRRNREPPAQTSEIAALLQNDPPARVDDTVPQDLNKILVNLSRRIESLVERQLVLIHDLERTEEDPDRLGSLFRLDHLATRMRRYSGNLLALADHEGRPRPLAKAVPLVDVVRAALSEIEQYERVVLSVQPGVQVMAQAVNDIVHLVAEVVENATAFSPAETPVHVTGQRLSSGGVLLEISDRGMGMSTEEMAHANWRLDNPRPVVDAAVFRHMGLFVVGRLAAKHGVRVRLRPAQAGGLVALIWLPEPLAAPEKAPAGRPFKSESEDPTPARFAHVVRLEGDPDSPDQRLPIFEAMESEWFRRRSTGRDREAESGAALKGAQSDDWSSPVDAGWQAASAQAGGTTPAGLPKRVPRANLLPGSVGAGEGSSSEIQRPLRSAEATRNRFASYQRGVRAGRSHARETAGYAGSSGYAPSAGYGSPFSPDSGPPQEGHESQRRYLTGILPERAPSAARISLLARITLAAAQKTSARLAAFPVGPRGTTVTITVSAPGLFPLGDLEQDLTVLPDADSQQVRFGFTTGPAGLHVVELRAFIGGTCLGELALQISVEPGAALEEGHPRAALMAGLAAEPGEVTLQVSSTAHGGYSFQLLSEALYPMKVVDRLAGDPAAVVGRMMEELRAIAKGQPQYGSPALVRNRLMNLGAKLWADVVPDVIREQFWEQRDRIRLFTIASDIDTVPWELLYPVDMNNDDGFLVEQFPVVRRVYGQGRTRVLRLGGGAGFIVPPRSPTNAMEEVAAVRGILPPDVIHRGTEADLAEVLKLLNTMPSVLHFAGHNAFTDEMGSLISLEGGPLRPDDLSYAKQKRAFEAVSPLVFFNGCRTAGEIPGFTQMNGWAKEFMGAGAGAFIGSLWAVRSSSARMFAEAFYHALVRDRHPLGTASLLARQAIAADEGDPTWLAYTIYGNPSASLENRLGPGRDYRNSQ